MPSLVFKQLSILTHTQKLGNQFTFKKGLNLITAKENSVGKSTLAKLLYWGLGCDPILDTAWKSLDCSTIVDFSIGQSSYSVLRTRNSLHFRSDGEAIKKYGKVSGAYAEMLAVLVGFHVLLPNKTTKALEVPPPAYYCLPFYIDQKKGWGSPWESFDKLAQYPAWKESVIKCHVGLLSAEYFENEKSISEIKVTQKKVEQEVVKLDNALEIVRPYVSSTIATMDQDALERLRLEIQFDLKKLVNSQESILDELSKAETNKANVRQQTVMLRAAVNEFDKDYKFAVENIHAGSFLCPLCSTEHDNSLINRTAILIDKRSAEEELDGIETLAIANDIKIQRLQTRLQGVREGIDAISAKYVIEEDEGIVETVDVINSIAASAIRDEVLIKKRNNLLTINTLKNELKPFVKIRKTLVTKEQIEAVNGAFTVILASFIHLLDAKAIDLSLVKSPTHYNAVFKEGGAAEGTRSILAYYLAVYSIISKFGTEVTSALVIDTPNQQEQSAANYSRIVTLLTEHLPECSQSIICALDREEVLPIKDKAHVIVLNESKLLNSNDYDKVADYFKEMGDSGATEAFN